MPLGIGPPAASSWGGRCCCVGGWRGRAEGILHARQQSSLANTSQISLLQPQSIAVPSRVHAAAQESQPPTLESHTDPAEPGPSLPRSGRDLLPSAPENRGYLTQGTYLWLQVEQEGINVVACPGK